MALGYDKPLYILAFDHRGSFQKKFFGVAGEPNAEETDRIADAKKVIYEGLLRALDEGVPKEAAGGLVDEQFGAEIARDAKVGMLLYYHIVPPLPFLPLREVFLEGVAEVYDGPVIIGSDGTFVRLEAGSDAIEVEELL